MSILDLFDILAKAICDNEKDYILSNKEYFIDKYKKMFLIDYTVKEDGLLNVSGRFNIFYDECAVETSKIKLKKDIYKFLVYDVTSHNGEWRIMEFEELKDIEDYILRPGGALNMFTTDLIVLEDLEVKHYNIYEILENGREIEVFDFDECSSDISPNLVVRWS